MTPLPRRPACVLGALAALVVTVSPVVAIAEPGEELDVGGARRGLAALAADLPPVGDFEPLSECPVVHRDAVIAALESAGIDSPLATFDRVDGPTLHTDRWSIPGVVCSGAYIGTEGDESFPETLITLTVAEFDNEAQTTSFLSSRAGGGIESSPSLPTPVIGGGTFGNCREIDLHTQCFEYWTRDGFMIAVQIDDRVAVDRPTASAVLIRLIPAVVGQLAAVPEPDVPVEHHAAADDIDSARVGLVEVLRAEPSEQCRVIDNDVFGSLLAGLSLPTGADLSLRASPAASAGDGLDRLGCVSAGDDASVSIFVQDFGDSDSAREVIELVHGCEQAGNLEFCVESWEQDGLTITATLTGADLEPNHVTELLQALVPAVLEHLAAGA